MTFIADHKAMRTYDPVRGLELVSDGGGSDRSRRFIFRRIDNPDEVLGGVNTYQEVRRPTDEEELSHPEAREVCVWVIYGGWAGGAQLKGYSLEESKEIIREAMLAYRDAHGSPVGSNAIHFDVKL